MTPEQLAKSGTEHAHQRALFARIAEYCNSPGIGTKQQKYYLKLLFAIPNGGERHAAVAGKMKAEGAKAGVWDLFLPVPDYVRDNSGYTVWHGLYIEMKEPGRRNHANGGLSDKQIDFGKAMDAQGYALAVCYTYEEAFVVLMKYLEGKHERAR